MKIFRWLGADPVKDAARRLYLATVAQARQPAFFAHCEVPDSVDGRFDMIALHAFLVLHRLKGERGPTAPALAQGVAEALFADMDRSLREMGAGDLGVGRRVKDMAKGFYGRVAAYDAGLAGTGGGADPGPLRDALRRNLYGTLAADAGRPGAATLSAMCGYVEAAVERLAACPLSELAAGRPAFPPPPLTGPAIGPI